MGRYPAMDESLRWHRALAPGAQPLTTRWTLMRAVLVRSLLVATVAVVSACAVGKALERTPGVDLSPVKVGATRQEVEAVVGEPLREWTTQTGVHYRLYHYDAGIEPSAGGAGFVVFMDVITLGLWEAYDAVWPEQLDVRGERKRSLLAVSYDPQGIVIGVFKNDGEFAELPEDGRPPAGPVPDGNPPDG